MITCYLQGGLGNQMFQAAATLNVAMKGDDEAIFCRNAHYLPLQGNDVTNYEDNVFRDLRFADKVAFSEKYQETSHLFEPIEYEEGICLVGYFQCEKYFQDHSEQILERLGPPEGFDTFAGKELSQERENVSVHVRRGDYLKFSDTHPPLPVKYYEIGQQAIDNNEEMQFNVFSDDIPWCREHLDFLPHVNFVDGYEDWEEMYMLSFCDHHIIANSSFSWWGARLSDSTNIISPSNDMWFGPEGPEETDIVPERWRKIDDDGG